MACCLVAPSHYVKQCYLIIKTPYVIHLRVISQEVLKISVHKKSLELKTFKITAISPPGTNELSESSCSSNHGLFLLLVGAGYGHIHNPPTTSCNIMTDFQANLHPDTDMAENMTVKIEGIIVKIWYMSLNFRWLKYAGLESISHNQLFHWNSNLKENWF